MKPWECTYLPEWAGRICDVTGVHLGFVQLVHSVKLWLKKVETCRQMSQVPKVQAQSGVLSLQYSFPPSVDRGSSSDGDKSSHRVEQYLYEQEGQ